MATSETVQLGPPHAPKEESIKLFNDIEVDLKKALLHSRHDATKHEPEYFAKVADLTDAQLTNFSSDDLEEVRVGTSAYGMHVFGKVLLPETGGSGYIQFRAFVAGDVTKLHSVHTEEKEHEDGSKSYKAIFSESDPLDWFET